ncbi:hypothetical protein AFC81_09205 [Mycobacterium avium subsp. paratuberculosis]|nr:hypothetical protein RE97_00370 [Mycobacterium avium subsp. paratuberculosis]ETB06854.1 hypothetical protein O979_00370 [Mycobacterium avium subsp. paratuberculosis 10-4404]ETB15153.1 hypothetical protein O980_00450 [Mycobacterium avium subsp. paratuberculosis 08-8281]ETB36957.1 hypothetical protein O977_00465 [Mycobacterium avium subsp. paratuberculosis 10-5975]ETB55137.1 hypothetical protein O976_00470 [Mycobacterium avium subsp. paratuberculosis 10-8425]
MLWSDPPTPTAIRGIPDTTACQFARRASEKGRRWSEGIQRRPFSAPDRAPIRRRAIKNPAPIRKRGF